MNAPTDSGSFANPAEQLNMLYSVRDGLAALAQLTASTDDPPPLWQVSSLIVLLATQMECAMQVDVESERREGAATH